MSIRKKLSTPLYRDTQVIDKDIQSEPRLSKSFPLSAFSIGCNATIYRDSKAEYHDASLSELNQAKSILDKRYKDYFVDFTVKDQDA